MVLLRHFCRISLIYSSTQPIVITHPTTPPRCCFDFPDRSRHAAPNHPSVASPTGPEAAPPRPPCRRLTVSPALCQPSEPAVRALHLHSPRLAAGPSASRNLDKFSDIQRVPKRTCVEKLNTCSNVGFPNKSRNGPDPSGERRLCDNTAGIRTLSPVGLTAPQDPAFLISMNQLLIREWQSAPKRVTQSCGSS